MMHKIIKIETNSKINADVENQNGECSIQQKQNVEYKNNVEC